MKKTTILLFVLCAFSYFAKAQSYTQSYVEGGIIVMPQYTSLLNTNDFAAGKDLDYATTFGYAGGLTGSYNFNKHIGIELNVIYSVQGQKYTGNLNNYKFNGADTASFARIIAYQFGNYIPTNGNFTEKISLTYLKIPIMFKYTSDATKSTFFYMSLGPEFNILLSASQAQDGSKINYFYYGTISSPLSIPLKQFYESLDVDAVLNLGMGYNLTSNLVLTAQINFDYGLTDAENKNIVFPGTTDHIYATNRSTTNNATVGLRLGVAYKFGDPDKISSKLTP